MAIAYIDSYRNNNFILIENPKNNNIIWLLVFSFSLIQRKEHVMKRIGEMIFLNKKKMPCISNFNQNIACSNLKTASILSVEECARNCESWIWSPLSSIPDVKSSQSRCITQAEIQWKCIFYIGWSYCFHTRVAYGTIHILRKHFFFINHLIFTQFWVVLFSFLCTEYFQL